MPVFKIFYDHSLDQAVRAQISKIEDGLKTVMRETLLADPEKCQTVFSSCLSVTPMKLYVDMQFRANELRTAEVINKAMKEVAALIVENLETSVRIRAFEIDQKTLYALDVEDRKLS